jgi:hypothetical protein
MNKTKRKYVKTEAWYKNQCNLAGNKIIVLDEVNCPPLGLEDELKIKLYDPKRQSKEELVRWVEYLREAVEEKRKLASDTYNIKCEIEEYLTRCIDNPFIIIKQWARKYILGRKS